MREKNISIESLHRRNFLRRCGQLTASIYFLGAWPFKAKAQDKKNLEVLIGEVEFEMSFRGPLKKNIYAGIGPSGRKIVAQLPFLLKGNKHAPNLLDDTELTPASFSHLADQIDNTTVIVHMIYDPNEVSLNVVRALLPSPPGDVLYHHLHITTNEKTIEPPLSMHESVTLILQKNMDHIYIENNGHKPLADQSLFSAWMIKTYLRIFQPCDYRYELDLPEHFKGTLNYLSCAYQPESSYTALVNEALNRLRSKLHIRSTRLLTACFGGSDSSLTMEAFDEGTQHLYSFAHDDCNAYNGLYLSNQSDHARWVVISAQKNINAPG